MLNEEELAVFLALLRQFAGDNGLSAVSCATVLSIPVATIGRWFRIMHDPSAKISIYRWNADAARAKIEKLNKINEERHIYRAISTQKPRERVQLLLGALEGRSVW